MLDITWKVFIQTGNIETYLLLKEMENVGSEVNEKQLEIAENTFNDIEEAFHK